MNKLQVKLSKFRRNRKAIAYIWGVAACTIIFIPIVYWVLSVFLDSIATAVFTTYTFTGTTGAAWLLVKTLISFLLGICLFIILIWSAINSKAQSYEA